MTSKPAAPEIFQIPVGEFDASVLPTNARKIGSDAFDMAVMTHYALHYANKGWNVAVVVNEHFIRVVAIPDNGMHPKDYVLGLLRHGFLEDALPILEALAGMLDDADILYNLGICYSELGEIKKAIAPLEQCVELDPNYVDAWTGLGVAYARERRPEDAQRVLRKALALDPAHPHAHRNLGAVLAGQGKSTEALPHLREAHRLQPSDPAPMLGLAKCLEQMGAVECREANSLYASIIERFPDHPLSEIAEQARTAVAHSTLRAAVAGELRIDAVMYMRSALEKFGNMPRDKLGQIVMEIALLGRKGLSINEPAVRYSLTNMPGDFSGLQLLSMMHVGIRMLDPNAPTGTDLDREYAAALGESASK